MIQQLENRTETSPNGIEKSKILITRTGIRMAATALLLSCTVVQAETASDVECTKCISASEISSGAVRKGHLHNGIVATNKLKDGAVSKSKLSPGVMKMFSDLQTQVTAMDAYIQKLQAYIEVDETTNPSRPVVRIAGANLQVVNGTGDTETRTGTGNVIIGYDEPNIDGNSDVCSDGFYTDQLACEGAGEIWDNNHKSGSHNLVIGPLHSYSQYGGLIAGLSNTVNSQHSSITGGYNNVASGGSASINGGIFNEASGFVSSISGGRQNVATSFGSSVSGGNNRTANGDLDWAAGGLYEDDEL